MLYLAFSHNNAFIRLYMMRQK